MAERSITVDHVTIYRCVQRFTPSPSRQPRPAADGTSGGGFRPVDVPGRQASSTYLRRPVDHTGGNWADAEVQVCTSGLDVLITSRKPDDLPAFWTQACSEFQRQASPPAGAAYCSADGPTGTEG
jgi:hypothetical protein